MWWIFVTPIIIGMTVSHSTFGRGTVIETDDRSQVAHIRFPSLAGSVGGDTAWVRYDQLHIQANIRRAKR